MGIYFDYDFKNGKEVERKEKCYLCENENILYAEYYILEGDVYKLYKDSRKIVRGHEVPVGSRVHAICDDCYASVPSEEELVEKILAKRLEEKKSEIKKQLKELLSKIESKKQEIELKEKELAVLRDEVKELEAQVAELEKSLG